MRLPKLYFKCLSRLVLGERCLVTYLVTLSWNVMAVLWCICSRCDGSSLVY